MSHANCTSTPPLSVTDWARPRGTAALEHIRLRDRPVVEGPAHRELLAGPSGPLTSSTLRVERISGTGNLPFSSDGYLRGLTVVAGTATLRSSSGEELRVERGRTAAVPARFIGAVSLAGCLAIASAAA